MSLNLLEVATGNVAFRQDFQIDALGRYSHQVQAFRLNRQSNDQAGRYLDTPCSTPYGSSLNRRVYRSLSQSGQACVYPTTDHPADNQFTPRTLLHALFDRRLEAALDDPCVHTIAKTDTGLIQVLHQEGPWIYHYRVDPDQDYMVVRFQQIPVEAEFSLPIYEHAISYRHTRSGFHYPARSYVKRFNQLKLLAATTLFRLNEGPISPTLSFPLGVPIKNYTCGLDTPIRYRSRVTAQSYEDITDTAVWVIRGVLVDANQRPLANIPVKLHPGRSTGGTIPTSFADNHLTLWDAITDEFGRFAIDIEKCSWQIYGTADRDADAVSYTIVFLPDDAPVHIADDIRAGEEPLCFRLSRPTAWPDAAQLPILPQTERATESSSSLTIGPRHDAQSVPILFSDSY
ncbi:MAG: hypothetical protein IIA65_06620 [Planctomycetes bacterium]|nr:hypothetical protein [Planctomycetota bacterium]